MNFFNLYRKGFILFFILVTSVYAVTLDEMIAKKDGEAITKALKSIKVVYDANDFPDDPKNNDLAIIEDDYNVQLVFEFTDGVWNERTDQILAYILNSKENLGFSHLFGFQLDERDFEQYTSDTKNIFVEILISKFNQENLSKSINNFILKKNIKYKDIINIQINKIDDKTSQIIIIYKY